METASINHHGQAQPYPPLPASPTLTNPDMILPDYDRASSPDPDLDAHDHSLIMWKNAHAATSVVDIHHTRHHPDHPYGPTGPITPTTPIIYGNGTMLSDIGEVTEVESTRGGPSPLRSRGSRSRQRSSDRDSGSDTPSHVSPAAAALEGMMTKRSKQSLAAQRERRSSIESTSTITTHEKQPNPFADFDDSISVDDSVFQGDDEESVAESYVQDAPPRDTGARLGVPNVDNSDRMSTYSASSSISKRVEHILANAKKKLTTMEGNLSRARGSLYVTTPSASGSDGSTPSPPMQRPATALYARDAGTTSSLFSPAHARLANDDGFQSQQIPTQRSASALGVSGGYRQPLTSPKSAESIQNNADGRPSYRRTWHQRDRTLEPLSEDAAGSGAASSSRDSGKLNTGPIPDQLLTPTFGSFSDGGTIDPQRLQRSTSVVQMRDLKDQVKDLKGKVSSLREQARVDSLKRRSLQTLRTPSPFTHARVDQWYASPQARIDADASEADPLSSRNPWNGELSTVDGDERPAQDGREKGAEDGGSGPSQEPDIQSDDQKTPPASAYQPSHREAEEEDDDGDSVSDMLTENGDAQDVGEANRAENEDADADGDDEDDAVAVAEPEPGQNDQEEDFGVVDDDSPSYESESGESMYHDTLQHPVSHEDREDAFDYEHFFLHSAMGTISQQRRGSGSSFDSNASVETARGPIAENRARRRSDASVSTVETFATANDGSAGSSHERGRSTGSVPEPFTTPSSRSGSEGPGTAKKTTPSPESHPGPSSRLSLSRHSTGSIVSIPEESTRGESKQPSQVSQVSAQPASGSHRPVSSSATTSSLHRPSFASFESTGTQRSFPLVNKPKKASSVGVLTPQGSSPDHDLRAISESLLNQATSAHAQTGEDGGVGGTGGAGGIGGGPAAPWQMSGGSQSLQTLVRDDRYLVERLVSGLGRCVLGLTENGRASAEHRMYRRRIDAARRILEGLDVVREGDD